MQQSFNAFLEHWRYDPRIPLNAKKNGVEHSGEVSVHDISFESPSDGRSNFVGPNGGLVTCYLVVPAGHGPFPVVIFGHWCMPGSTKRNRTEFLDEAIVLAQHGVMSLLPDHVTVRPGFAPDTSPLNLQNIAVEVQQNINLRRGADLLLQRKDVDPKRLAYVGHSCDATAGGFLSGIDRRFKAFVLMAGDLSLEVDRQTPYFQKYRHEVGAKRFDDHYSEFAWIDVGQYVSRAAPAAVFLQYGDQEPFLNRELAAKYFAIVSEPKKLVIYRAEHALDADATRDRILFLAERLSFRRPSEQAINSIPPLFQPPWPKNDQ